MTNIKAQNEENSFREHPNFELNLIFELGHSFGIWILEFDIGHQPKMLLLPLYLSVSYWV
jgi:hypothetical protein